MTLLWVLCLLVLSNGLLTIHPPPVEGEPTDLIHYDSDYCTPPTMETPIPLVYLENVDRNLGCTDFSFLPDLTGKIAWVPECNSCCRLGIFAKALQLAGAVGVIQPGDAMSGMLNSGLSESLSMFCYGVINSNFTDSVEDWLSAGDEVTARAFQPPLHPDMKTVLLSIFTQSNGKSPWDVHLDPCQHALPTVPSRPFWSGVACSVDGLIVSLTIKFPINGLLPDNFCSVQTALNVLTIQDDATFKGMPACDFPELRSLTITGTPLTSISNKIWALPNILFIDLSNNDISGPLSETWSSTLTNLNLQNNEFSGPIPAALLSNLPNLQFVSLAQNNLEGVVPDFTRLPGAQTIDLSDNYLLNFTEPTGNATSLQTLELSFNQFTTFPAAFLNRLPALYTLNLDHNNFTSLPDTTVLPSLRTLDISYNQLTGSFFVLKVTVLFASNNQLSYVGPGNSILRTLDLTNNNLTTMPQQFQVLTSLYLGFNKITAIDFTGYSSLLTADLSNNQITGGLDFIISPSLASLDLSNNKLTGKIPTSFLSTLLVVRLTGNQLSHEGTSLLPPQAIFGFATARALNDRGLECPTYTLKDGKLSELSIDPSYHSYILCRCLPGFYRLPDVTEYCAPCLPNAICPGKENPLTLKENANIMAETGYFPIPDDRNPTQMIPCRFGVVLASDPANPCNPDVQSLVADAYNTSRPSTQAVPRFRCSTGYSDRLCARCESGWFRKEGRCLRCNNRAEYPLFLIAIVIIFLCACVYFTLRTPVDTSTTSINPDGWTFEPKQRIYDFIPLVLHFFQTSTIVLVKLDALDVVQTLNSLLVTASFSTPQSGIGFECGLPVFQGFVTQYLAVVIFPPVLAVVLLLFFVSRLIHHHYNGVPIVWHMTFYQYIYGIGSMMEAIHFPLVTYVLGVFQCTKDPISGISYFTDHPYLTCDSISPAGKIFPLLLYPIGLVGFFIGLGVYLHYAPSDVKESEPVLQSFAFFFIRFKPDRVASGVFFILVNLSLSLVVGLMEANTDVFPTLVVLVLIVDFFFVTVFQPYLQPRYNKVRSVNDLVALLLFVNNLIYSSTSQFPGRSASPATIYVGLNAGMVTFYCYHLYRIIKLHRTDHTLARLGRANSGAIDPHRPETRKHLELTEIKSRKHTNIDPPSTSMGGDTHGSYQPVSTQSPAAVDNAESSSHSPLPIISEHETSEYPNSTKAQTTGLVFTPNPLADTADPQETSASSSEPPPSPSSKD